MNVLKLIMYFRNRKLNRCLGWDYTSVANYFVTICVRDKKRILADFVDGKMVINGLGIKVVEIWEKLPNHYHNCCLDEFALMPDHVHGIIKLINSDEKYPLWEIVRGFKTFSSKYINQFMFGGFKWQKSFYDKIIHNQIELEKIRSYIRSNPEKVY